MSLPAGARLGHYEILEFCAAGGMGEVYRARDTKLQRDVALKVLPELFLSDPERLARFRREAQVLAALNHPNIAAIHGLEEAGDVRALVMEFVDGETLADVIAGAAKGPGASGTGGVDIHQAISIARQIADALEAAHEQGIIHRDLKPANVKIRPNGTVKVLDFGLAKALDTTTSSGPVSASPDDSPTLTSPVHTMHGVILGTAAYMSPEQARGKPADQRSDIWAFGVVLYEMVTGRRLFRGDHLTDVLAAVVRDAPDLSAAPPAVRRLLEKCLEKDRRQRLRHISSVGLLLDEPSATASAPPVPNVPFLTRPRLAVLGIVGLVPAAVLAFLLSRQQESSPQAVEFSVHPPAGTTLVEPYSIAAVSPDGRHLLFGTGVFDPNVPSGSTARHTLWIRPTDSAKARLLPGTEDATAAMWSPDSRTVAFVASHTLKRIEIAGGPPVKVADVPSADRFDSGTWSADGIILLACSCGLERVAVASGEVTRLRAVDKAANEKAYSSPQFLPDGDRFLYFVASDDAKVQGVYVSSLSRPDQRTLLLNTAAKAMYVPRSGGAGGHLLWITDQTLQARPFNADSLTFDGGPTAIAEGLSFSDLSTQMYSLERAAFWASATGLLVYAPAVVPSYAKLPVSWVDRNGRIVGDAVPEGPYNAIAISPDQHQLALTRRGIPRSAEPNGDLWLWNVERETMTRATFHPATEENPVWSPDGQQIAFSANRDGTYYQVYRRSASGTGDDERLTNVSAHTDPLAWSPDGRFVVYRQMNRGTGWDLMALPLDRRREPIVLLQTPESDSDARFSADGRFLLYHSRLNGRTIEVYLQALRGDANIGLVGERLQVSNNGGAAPLWRRDGREVYYHSLDGKIMAVNVQLAPAPRVERPRELFQANMVANRLHAWDVTADGQRFLMVLNARSTPEPLHLNVVTNWQRRLEK
jgi:serine/threonine protein kinase